MRGVPQRAACMHHMHGAGGGPGCTPCTPCMPCRYETRMSDEEIRHGIGAAARRAASHDVDALMAGKAPPPHDDAATGPGSPERHDLAERPSEEEARKVGGEWWTRVVGGRGGWHRGHTPADGHIVLGAGVGHSYSLKRTTKRYMLRPFFPRLQRQHVRPE